MDIAHFQQISFICSDKTQQHEKNHIIHCTCMQHRRVCRSAPSGFSHSRRTGTRFRGRIVADDSERVTPVSCNSYPNIPVGPKYEADFFLPFQEKSANFVIRYEERI